MIYRSEFHNMKLMPTALNAGYNTENVETLKASAGRFTVFG